MLEWSVLRGTSYFSHQPSVPSPRLPPSRMRLPSSCPSAAGSSDGPGRALPFAGADGGCPLEEGELGVRLRRGAAAEEEEEEEEAIVCGVRVESVG